MFERERCEVIISRSGLTNKQENTGIRKTFGAQRGAGNRERRTLHDNNRSRRARKEIKAWRKPEK